jgi:hypothetical protein
MKLWHKSLFEYCTASSDSDASVGRWYTVGYFAEVGVGQGQGDPVDCLSNKERIHA